MSKPMTPNNPLEKKYRSYLLRLWRPETPGQAWRAFLEDLRTGERIGFESLEHLFAFMMELVEREAKGGRME